MARFRRSWLARRFGLLLAGVVLCGLVGPALAPVQARAAAPTLTEGKPEDVGMSASGLAAAYAFVQSRVDAGLFPGAVVLVARQGKIVGLQAFGTMEKGSTEPMRPDALFDQESITKVVSTATTAMILVQEGKLGLDDPVAKYIPAFAANGKANITVREMLEYSAGLPVDNQFLDIKDPAVVWQKMYETPLEYKPETQVEYSDLTYRTLGKVIEAAAGKPLDQVAREKVWAPLGMNDTMYNPPASLKPRIAGTGYSALRGRTMRGEVADEQDFALGGVVGCDGIFTTAKDLAILGQLFLNGGSYGDATLLKPETVAQMTTSQTPWADPVKTDTSRLANLLFTPKGFGWELMTPRFSPGGTKLSPRAYGKTGGAGTFMWVDPTTQTIAIYLTNHGLPVPFDEPGWNGLLDRTAPDQVFNLIAESIPPSPPAPATPVAGTPAA